MMREYYSLVLILIGICVLCVSCFGLGVNAGKRLGVENPFENHPPVDVTKVIGWCVQGGAEEMMGVYTPEQIKELMPLMIEQCEDRWLAFNKRWERKIDE